MLVLQHVQRLIFEIIFTGSEKLPAVDEINLSGEAAVCSLFSKNYTRNTFSPLIPLIQSAQYKYKRGP